ncbi:MAG: hypothetical protein IJM79_08990 [Erysipelotrichaceae bacterium]|nr:hypothetical protein [Erysipelotrichaceae bacterium]
MFENALLILADVVIDPMERITSSDGFVPVVGAVAAVVVGAVLFLLKKKK